MRTRLIAAVLLLTALLLGPAAPGFAEGAGSTGAVAGATPRAAGMGVETFTGTAGAAASLIPASGGETRGGGDPSTRTTPPPTTCHWR